MNLASVLLTVLLLFGPPASIGGKATCPIMPGGTNMLSIGRGREARQWLRRRLPKAEWSWLRKHDRELRGIVATAARRRAWTSQKQILDQADILAQRPPTHETE